MAPVAIALETSARPGSVAARRGEARVLRPLDDGAAHGRDLLPALSDALDELDARPADVTAIVVGTGPGSFTGLRVGIATALGLARGTGAALRGVPSVEALAWERLAPGESCTVLLDARSRQLYLARYAREEPGLVTLLAPCIATADELPGLLPAEGAILGDATVADAARLDAAARARLVTDARASAAALLELGELRLAALGPQAPGELEPLYLRAFAARARAR